MAKVGRLAGAILAETEGQFFLVGNPKEPCDFVAVGFENPGVIDALTCPFIKLSAIRPVQVPQPYLTMTVEGDALARLLVDRFVIQRNGSVSDRLWRLVTDPQQEHRAAPAGVIDARWLGEIPAEIWRIVRETVLKCT
ncbi:Precorrin-3B C(17)-methyltransferase [Nitrospira defluvii]|uniref:Precorrin-3B C(17)-methyltransferase n=1 Tax=Nitrospira defluvii TaxID=330214 RepID=A0ABM8RYC0_9BACT|nr:precorrin-3B C(17)-methyltransferase [Nitrospira defluvii]CAE6778046.1 Precorrin-3B C(17)-methyltransferase [Nitrospira defluvii]